MAEGECRSGPAPTQEECAIAPFLSPVLPLKKLALLGGLAEMMLENDGMAAGLLNEWEVLVVGFLVIRIWGSSVMVTVRRS